MDLELLTTSATFAGVLIGASIAALIAFLLSRREIISEVYASPLVQVRIEKYPKLYKILSDFDKEIRFKTGIPPEYYNDLEEIDYEKDDYKPINQDLVKLTLKLLLSWDSENAVFLSDEAGWTLHNYRLVLHEFANLPSNKFEVRVGSPKTLKKELLEGANDVENALKRDLAIYRVARTLSGRRASSTRVALARQYKRQGKR